MGFLVQSNYITYNERSVYMTGLDITGVLYSDENNRIELGYYVTGSLLDGTSLSDELISMARIIRLNYLKALNTRGWVFDGILYKTFSGTEIPVPLFKNVLVDRTTTNRYFNQIPDTRRMMVAKKIGEDLTFDTKDAVKYNQIIVDVDEEVMQTYLDNEERKEAENMDEVDPNEKQSVMNTLVQGYLDNQDIGAESNNTYESPDHQMSVGSITPEEQERLNVQYQELKQRENQQEQIVVETTENVSTQIVTEQSVIQENNPTGLYPNSSEREEVLNTVEEPKPTQSTGGTEMEEMKNISDDFRVNDSVANNTESNNQVEQSNLKNQFTQVTGKELFNRPRSYNSIVSENRVYGMMPVWTSLQNTHQELLDISLQGFKIRTDKSEVLAHLGINLITDLEEYKAFMKSVIDGTVSLQDPRLLLNTNWFVHPDLLHNSLSEWKNDELVQTYLVEKPKYSMHYSNLFKQRELFAKFPNPLISAENILGFRSELDDSMQYEDSIAPLAHSMNYLMEEPIECFDHLMLGDKVGLYPKVEKRGVDQKGQASANFVKTKYYLDDGAYTEQDIPNMKILDDDVEQVGAITKYAFQKMLFVFKYEIKQLGSNLGQVVANHNGDIQIQHTELLNADIINTNDDDESESVSQSVEESVFIRKVFSCYNNSGEAYDYPDRTFKAETLESIEIKRVYSEIKPLLSSTLVRDTSINPIHSLIEGGLNFKQISKFLEEQMPSSNIKALQNAEPSEDQSTFSLFNEVYNVFSMGTPSHKDVNLITNTLRNPYEISKFGLLLERLSGNEAIYELLKTMATAIEAGRTSIDKIAVQIKEGKHFEEGLDLGLSQPVKLRLTVSPKDISQYLEEVKAYAYHKSTTSERSSDNTKVYQAEPISIVTNFEGDKDIALVYRITNNKETENAVFISTLPSIKNYQFNLGNLALQNIIVQYDRAIALSDNINRVPLNSVFEYYNKGVQVLDITGPSTFSDPLPFINYMQAIYTNIQLNVWDKGLEGYMPTPFEIISNYEQPNSAEDMKIYSNLLDMKPLSELIRVRKDGAEYHPKVVEYINNLVLQVSGVYVGEVLPPAVDPSEQNLTAQQPVQEPVQEPVQQPTQEPVQEPVQESVQEPVQEPSPVRVVDEVPVSQRTGVHEYVSQTPKSDTSRDPLGFIYGVYDINATKIKPTSIKENTIQLEVGGVAVMDKNNPSNTNLVAIFVKRPEDQTYYRVSLVKLIQNLSVSKFAITNAEIFSTFINMQNQTYVVDLCSQEYFTFGPLVDDSKEGGLIDFENKYLEHLKGQANAPIPPHVSAHDFEHVNQIIAQSDLVKKTRTTTLVRENLYKYLTLGLNTTAQLVGTTDTHVIYTQTGYDQPLFRSKSELDSQEVRLRLGMFPLPDGTYIVKLASGRVVFLDSTYTLI